ncbi:MAG: type II and III secretion system protein family protein [Nitrospira sp.]|uniref:Putative Pilus assembly protein CpaC n=1 Tax=Candidatus Nitrospira inopinata TaxID=1715989 RepID=A0A0S4KN73_9BACT|nr:type II and III secretion system protein family protein [Nitrospira sp.]CUQ65799.1 putative Pilus assembly protein CpaC [Candidatus Nitrospira inopinata]
MTGIRIMSEQQPGKRIRKRIRLCRALLLGLVTLFGSDIVSAPLSWAADPSPGAPGGTRPTIRLTVGGSQVLDLNRPTNRASIANPDVADTIVLSPRQLYILGKVPGVTTLMVWSKNEESPVAYDITVEPNVTELTRLLKALYPNDGPLQVTTAGDQMVVSGTVASAARLSQILAIAEAYAPKRVINLLSLKGPQQVMLEVRVAEIDRSLLRRLGVNGSVAANNGREFGVSVLKNLTSILPAGDSAAAIAPIAGAAAPFGIGLGPTISALFRGGIGNTTWTAFLDALKEENLVKVLAEPTLVTINGQEASVLAGGEFPIPIPQAFGVTTVQYKSFGVQLKFRPMVLDHRRISITVTPEVSELDFAKSLTLQGFAVPSVTTRRASTTVELEEGQSFVVAGLLRDNVREIVSKFPYLGDVPVLGALFRSTKFEKNESELIILVTPRFAAPVQANTLSLPTDRYQESSEADQFLYGRTGRHRSVGSAPAADAPNATGNPTSSRQGVAP